ncbi:hypothetical protein K2173_027746 [Erythroxylum novogranatense]|uniref:AMP-dependent synthetase/ligase domain-containing protein n=1 Tax=Erythroxylum novogranatense TaxID=1862640 RepID=A0AAV8U2W0_9ROSI|nr:hypothetical protein K2173_027746 [Erythroxylum novogranatense]
MNYENYDPSFPDQPVVDLYLPTWANLQAFMFKPAFVWVEEEGEASKFSSLTYGQLNESVQSISSQLLLSQQRVDTVLVLCSPGLELRTYISPDLSFSNQNYHHLVRVISQTNPKAAIAEPEYIARVQQYISSSSSSKNLELAKLLRTVKWISTFDVKNKKLVGSGTSSSSTYSGCKPDEVYLIQYTSGATGIPKPVLVTAGSAVHNVRVARKAYELGPHSVIASWLPQYHDCGLQFLLLTIISGATCVLASPTAFLYRPRLWLEMISEFKATCTPVPSFTLPLVVKRGGVNEGTRPISLWSMKNLILINEPIYKVSVDEFVDLFKPFGLNPSCISPSYGLAENCTFVSTAWRSHTSFTNIPTYKKLLPSARLGSQLEEYQENEDMNIVVVNEDTNEVLDDGLEGEIWVSSPSNCSGYLSHPSLTREIFQARLLNSVSKCFVRTGDRGVIKGKDRYLFVTGRCSDVIKLRNNQEVHPHYIETAAHNSCQKFIRGGCLAAFEVSGTVVLVGELQRNDKDERVLRNICEEMKKAVSREEQVEIGLFVLVKCGSLSKTTSGKIQRWVAKHNLVQGKMKVVTEMRFENDASSFSSPSKTTDDRTNRNQTLVALPTTSKSSSSSSSSSSSFRSSL